MTSLRKHRFAGDRANGLGLALLLLLAVLAPTVCLLWFMNRAAENERLALRQRLTDAYRAQLALAEERLDTHWRELSLSLDQEAEKLSPSALFARLVRNGEADSVIIYKLAGQLAYPTFATPPDAVTTPAEFAKAQELENSAPADAAQAFAAIATSSSNTDLAARALQAQARCLLAAGKTAAALTLLSHTLAADPYRHATDFQGRLIAPNALMLALERLKDSAPEQIAPLLDDLSRRLNDYDDPSLPASQRRFLMHELERLYPGRAVLPTLAAEDLAARYLETGADRVPESGELHHEGPSDATHRQITVHQPAPDSGRAILRPTPLPAILQFASASGRVVILHETAALVTRLRAHVSPPAAPSKAVIQFLPPGREPAASALTAAAGLGLPGWRLQIALNDSPFEEAARQRIGVYIWVGILVIAAVLVLALLALGLVRRQVALTQLRNDLVANVTHELKTPLASMRLLVDTLLDSQTLDEKTAREYLALIARENLRLSRLIENFLAFSRMERNKYALNFKTVGASEIVAGAAAAVHERFNEPGCHFAIKTDGALPAVNADPDAMITALVNLLDNAYKYSGDEKQITLLAGTINGSVVFKVTDNGIGLSPRETKRIFKRFYRVDSHRSTSVTGCGLGLSIVQFIVTAHNGDVRVESEPGHGSTFAISLPAKTMPANLEVL